MKLHASLRTLIPGAIFLAASMPASATLVLDVNGPSDLGHIIQRGQAAVAAFTLSNSFSNVSISANLFCILSCNGGAYLTTELGSTFNATHIVAGTNYTVGSPNLLFTGLNLAADTYYLVVHATAGTIIWDGSTTPVVTGDPAANNEIVLFSTLADPLAPASTNFTATLDRSTFFNVTGSAPITAAPEPAQALLMGTGVLALAWSRRRKTA